MAAGAGLGAAALPANARDDASDLRAIIESLPNISGHEHWGSIPAIGQVAAGFKADLVAGVEPDNACLFDLLFDPYSGMNYGAMGKDPHAEAKARGHGSIVDWGRKYPEEAWREARTLLEPIRSTGWFACTAAGIQSLYGVSLWDLLVRDADDTGEVLRLNEEINSNYKRLITWYKRAYRSLGIETILRPAELEFGFHEENPEERKIMAPLLRIDQFCSFYQRRDGAMKFCVEHTGIDPKTADEFREFLGKCFDAAEQTGFKGTKQLQAYSRPLNFQRPKDSSVHFGPTEDREERLRFGDFIVYECMELAGKRGWSHQIHTGTHNWPDSNPMPLKTLFHTFRNVDFILIHCWPYVTEAAYLAKSYANVYLDTCWSPVLNPAFFRQEMEEWIGYLPDTKVTIGHDSTSVEMAAGSASICRAVLADVLQGRIREGSMTFDTAVSLAEKYLAGNARRIYDLS